MSRKTTAAFVAALGINFAMAGGAIMLANLNKPAEFDIDDAFTTTPSDIKTVAGKPVDASAGDVAVPLKAAQQGGNTRVTFTCGKDTGGGTREVHDGTWDQITGGILFSPSEQRLIAVEAVFDTRSLRTDAHGLTTTVTVNEKWFDIDNHPLATFKCDTVKPADAATPSYTHDLIGTFTLNGITKALTIPAKLTFAGQSLTLDASFTILRSEFEVEKRASSVAGTLGGVVSTVDNEVEMSVRVTASPDPSAVIAELAMVVAQQQEELRKTRADIQMLQPLSRRIETLEQRADELARQRPSEAPAVDSSALPKAYTDHSTGYTGPEPFEMVLVPGDKAQGIEPFYMSETEVNWAMVDKWMFAGDLDGESETVIAELREIGLRPTPLYGDPTATIQYNDKANPAMAVSRLTATAYCKWLSEKTGRHYRLPTMEEWQHALKAGGGVPANLDEVAWHANNSPKREDNDVQLTSPVGQKQPNAIGLFDMLGSVSEWVTNTGEQRIVVGGSIFTDPGEITADWQAVEDLDVWSESYPNYPKSKYWYSDFYVTGIRLVCEPASVVANPPKEVE